MSVFRCKTVAEIKLFAQEVSDVQKLCMCLSLPSFCHPFFLSQPFTGKVEVYKIENCVALFKQVLNSLIKPGL